MWNGRTRRRRHREEGANCLTFEGLTPSHRHDRFAGWR